MSRLLPGSLHQALSLELSDSQELRPKRRERVPNPSCPDHTVEQAGAAHHAWIGRSSQGRLKASLNLLVRGEEVVGRRWIVAYHPNEALRRRVSVFGRAALGEVGRPGVVSHRRRCSHNRLGNRGHFPASHPCQRSLWPVFSTPEAPDIAAHRSLVVILGTVPAQMPRARQPLRSSSIARRANIARSDIEQLDRQSTQLAGDGSPASEVVHCANCESRRAISSSRPAAACW